MSDNDWVVAFSTSDIGLQTTACMLLDEARIKHRLKRNAERSWFNVMDNILIMVAQNDMEAASTALQELAPEQSSEWRKDNASSGMLLARRMLFVLFIIAASVFLINIYTRYLGLIMTTR